MSEGTGSKSPLDPDLLATFARLREAGSALPDPADVGVEAAQASRQRYYRFLASAAPVAAMDTVSDVNAMGPNGRVLIRLYFPTSKRPAPVIVFIHGGGWWTGDVAAYDHLTRRLAAASGCAVASVDYRLWPAHRFPAAIEDCDAAFDWILNEGKRHGLDTSRLALCGDSAGATMSLTLALEHRGVAAIRGLALAYGVFTTDTQTPSWQRIGDGSFGLSVRQMRWIWEGYLPSGTDERDVRVSPGEADPAGLPPVWLMSCAFDPLVDDSERLGRRLEAAGVPVEWRREGGMTHGVWMMHNLFPRARASVEDAAKTLAGWLRD